MDRTPKLPRPVSTTDVYLAAILAELQAIRTEITLTPAAPPVVLDIREPAPPPGTPIPDDFPGCDALVTAGIVYLESIPRDGDALVAIRGIGRVTAGQILARLA